MTTPNPYEAPKEKSSELTPPSRLPKIILVIFALPVIVLALFVATQLALWWLGYSEFDVKIAPP